jgi:hypothetical protein
MRPAWVLNEDKSKKLHYLSFGAFEDDLPRFRDRLSVLHVERLAPPPGFESNGQWFRDHNGVLVEIGVAEILAQREVIVHGAFSACGRAGRELSTQRAADAPAPACASRALHRQRRPRDRFLPRCAGLAPLRLVGRQCRLLHGPHGSDHHMVAFARSGGPGLHRCSWDVGAVQEIGLGAMQMAGKAYTAGWGLGRHVLGSNYFHYVRGPWGSYCIPADHDWRSADHPGEDSFFLWGPNPPEDFVRNYEIET